MSLDSENRQEQALAKHCGHPIPVKYSFTKELSWSAESLQSHRDTTSICCSVIQVDVVDRDVMYRISDSKDLGPQSQAEPLLAVV